MLLTNTAAAQDIATLVQTSMVSLITSENIASSTYVINTSWHLVGTDVYVKTTVATSVSSIGTELESYFIYNTGNFTSKLLSTILYSTTTGYTISSIYINIAMTTASGDTSSGSGNGKQATSITNFSSYGAVEWVIFCIVLLAIVALIVESIVLYKRCKKNKQPKEVQLNPQSLAPTGWPEVMPNEKMRGDTIQGNIIELEDDYPTPSKIETKMKVQQNLSNTNNLQSNSSVSPPPKFSELASPSADDTGKNNANTSYLPDDFVETDSNLRPTPAGPTPAGPELTDPLVPAPLLDTSNAKRQQPPAPPRK